MPGLLVKAKYRVYDIFNKRNSLTLSMKRVRFCVSSIQMSWLVTLYSITELCVLSTCGCYASYYLPSLYSSHGRRPKCSYRRWMQLVWCTALKGLQKRQCSQLIHLRRLYSEQQKWLCWKMKSNKNKVTWTVYRIKLLSLDKLMWKGALLNLQCISLWWVV